MNCPTCKLLVQAGMQKCPNCGTPLASSAPGPGPAAPSVPAQQFYGPRRNSNLAVSSMVFAGLVFLFGPLAGAAAVITGHMAKKEIRSSNGALGGEGLATAGLAVGYVAIGLSILFLLSVLSLL